MKFTKEQLLDLIEDEKSVNIRTESVRWGILEDYVIQFQGKFYQVSVYYYLVNGRQIFGINWDTEGVEVEEKEVLVKKWVRVK